MELEFDKEIDAMLRRAGGSAGPAPPGGHPDADVLAAYVENALPSSVRSLYTGHFADCDKCRRRLSLSIEFLADEEASAPGPVIEPAAAVLPWYGSLFRSPNLAMAMGALVLTFGGILGYLALRNGASDSNTAVTQVRPGEIPASAPDQRASADTSADIATETNTTAGTIMPTTSNSTRTANSAAAAIPNNSDARPGRVTASETLSASGTGSAGISAPMAESSAEVASAQPKTAEPVPPPAVTMSKAESGAEKELRSKDDAPAMMAKKRGEEDFSRSRRDLPASPSKGPARSGPINMNQSQQNSSNVFDMSVSRSAGGRTFNNRQGAWYDSAYRGQATINIRRGSEEYKKLDKKLRQAVDQIGGTVVIVWGGKAYRIQ